MGPKDKLSAKEISHLLKVPLITIQRWVHQGKIPCKHRKNEYYFRRNEILEWARSHQFVLEDDQTLVEVREAVEKVSLSLGIAKGGVFQDLPGRDIFSVLKNGLEKISLPKTADKKKILDDLLNREEIASTGVGKGVAIPHPRQPLPLNLGYPIIPVFWLQEMIDFNSVDGQPVHVVIFLFCSTTQMHLKILSRLSYCLRDNDFLDLIKKPVDQKTLLTHVAQLEERLDPLSQE
jgi:PTS system nitrogen regulatory IIA component